MKLNRRSIRLKGYDYSQDGVYFVTICTHDCGCVLGNVVDGEMVLNEFGKNVQDEWLKSAEIRNEIELDEFVVMPNHFHGIVCIYNDDIETTNDRGGNGRIDCRGDRPVAPTGPRTHSLGALIAGFKSIVTKRINEMCYTPGMKLWQRNYYEHIIRDDADFDRIRRYIFDNISQWESDRE